MVLTQMITDYCHMNIHSLNVFFGHKPMHPGKMLRSRFLEPSGITQGELGSRLGISRRRINELLNGHRGVTADTALRLASYFKTDPFMWTLLQANYDLHHSWQMLRRNSLTKTEEGKYK
jgi:addiction module HigA family antidote